MPRAIAFAPPPIDQDVVDAVTRVLHSGWITTGPEVVAFERELEEFTGGAAAVCGNSWTAMAELALRWYGVGPGDEVIVPAYTYCATANIVVHLGATPVMVDSAGSGFNTDWPTIQRAITPRTKVIIPVDFAGHPVDRRALAEGLNAPETRSLFCPATPAQEALGRPLWLADAAHALGAEQEGRRVGSWADVAGFSFHAVKNLTTAEGGALLLNLPGMDNRAVAAELKTLGLHGQNRDAAAKFKSGAWRYDVITPGYKCNLSDIHAAMGRVQLGKYDKHLAMRAALADRYDQQLANLHGATLPERGEASNARSADHLYPLRIPAEMADRRDELIEHLRSKEIASNVHFQPLPLLSAYGQLGYKSEDYPRAMAAFSREISLPLHTQMSIEDVDRVAEEVYAFLQLKP